MKNSQITLDLVNRCLEQHQEISSRLRASNKIYVQSCVTMALMLKDLGNSKEQIFDYLNLNDTTD